MKQTAAVITVSDKGSRGERVDTSGPALCALLESNGCNVIYRSLVPDEKADIKRELLHCCDTLEVAMVLTTGGTGFSPRDITPEATTEVVERLTPGIAETMRAESMKLTPHGCLSRAVAGIRGRTLIINLPGSEKAAKENYLAVEKSIGHGIAMLQSSGSADCAGSAKRGAPSMDAWLREAKQDETAGECGMYLFHNGVVRRSARAQVRNGETAAPVETMTFGYDAEKVAAAVENAKKMAGIRYIRVWLNEGELHVGDDIMLVLVGGDIRPHVVDALTALVGELKTHCVTEIEHSAKA